MITPRQTDAAHRQAAHRQAARRDAGALAFAAAFLALFVAAHLVAQGFRWGAGLLPLVITAAGAAVALGEVLRILARALLRRRRGPGPEDMMRAAATEAPGGEALQPPALRAVAVVVLWILAYYGLIWATGMILAQGVFCFLFLTLAYRTGPVKAAVIAALSCGVVYGLSRLLDLRLPAGALL